MTADRVKELEAQVVVIWEVAMYWRKGASGADKPPNETLEQRQVLYERMERAYLDRPAAVAEHMARDEQMRAGLAEIKEQTGSMTEEYALGTCERVYNMACAALPEEERTP